MATVYYDDDADLGLAQSRKIAVLGYGSQGHAHALCLKDSGCEVRVGLAEGSKSRAKAEAAGLEVLTPAKAAEWADLITVLVPDTVQRHLYARAGALVTTFQEETETDLFGEQTVLCGGVSALIQSGFDTLVKAGYQPEVAYFECLHELKMIVDMIYEGGLGWMRYSVSDTAEYGDYSRGPRVVGEASRAEMERILEEVRSGAFAREWVAEDDAGRPNFNRMRAEARDHQIERVGRPLRAMMSWLRRPEGE